MSDNRQAGKGDGPRNVGPKFRANHPKIDWVTNRPQRRCAFCNDPIDKRTVIVGSRYYCSSDCAKGRVSMKGLVRK
jgi:hypothetical protein